MKTVVFLSNYLNHHQAFLSDALFKRVGEDYIFIACLPINEERKAFGWAEVERPYLRRSYIDEKSYKDAISCINQADVVIYGSAPIEMVADRIKAGKLTFRYSERVYKKEPPLYQMPLRALKYFWQYGRHKNVHLLCASAYTAGDYARTRTFLGKAYKWGYFTEVKQYADLPLLMAGKRKNSLLWVARFITLKHPEAPIEVAKRLAADGYDFELNIIGTGALAEKMQHAIDAAGLSGRVRLLGSMPPEEVRTYMEQSEIFMFTSDRQEGWGAVLNESMNSACAVVASHAIGAAPFLVKDGENGFLYRDGDIDDLYRKVKWLLDHPEDRERFGLAAYRTMVGEWNADNAAERFLSLATALLQGDAPCLQSDGVCSKSPLIRDDWYRI